MAYGVGVNTPQEKYQDPCASVGEWLTLPDVAELLNIPVTRVHRLIEDGALVDVRVGQDAVRKIPAVFFVGSQIAPHLEGTITLLKDQGLSHEEIVEWLCTPDESLPGAPIEHLRSGQRGEVRRRAQVLGF